MMDDLQWGKNDDDFLCASNEYADFSIKKSEANYDLTVKLNPLNKSLMDCIFNANTCQSKNSVQFIEEIIRGKTCENLEAAKNRAYQFTTFMKGVDLVNLSKMNTATLMTVLSNKHSNYRDWFGSCKKIGSNQI